jgi:type IV secretion system protein TrbG
MRAKLVCASALVAMAGCASQQPAATPTVPIVTQQSEATAAATSHVTGATVLAAYPAQVREAIIAHHADKDWPHYSAHGRVLYPYADNLPTPAVTCVPLHSTDIALEAGETISDVALGDSARWMADPASSGDPSTPTPHISIKCVQPGIDTSLDVYTTKRVYRFDLQSKAHNGMQMIAFYYPDDIVARMTAADAAPADAPAAVDPALPDDPGVADFDYKISGPDVPWKPVRAFSDIKHRVFIQMPKAMAWSESPALMLVNGRDPQMVNYRTHGDYLIVDRLFTKAELVSGVGREQDKVLIEHTGAQP